MAKIVSRNTRAKSRIEEILKSEKIPLTLNDIHARVLKSLPQIAYSTVFRIIQKFEKEKLITRTNWKDRGALFEWSDRKHHHHLICEKCESVEDINDSLIGYSEEKLKKNTNYIITSHTLEFVGICKPCQNSTTK